MNFNIRLHSYNYLGYAISPYLVMDHKNIKMLFLHKIYETLSVLRGFLVHSDIMATSSTLGLLSFLQQPLKVALRISLERIVL